MTCVFLLRERILFATNFFRISALVALVPIPLMYDLNETIAAGLLEGVEYPWEALKGISDFIRSLGPSLRHNCNAEPEPN